MAVLPPLEKTVLQSGESDADAEMSSSSLSEEDALEYDMSEDLEDSPAVNSPPSSSKPQKGDKYKNRGISSSGVTGFTSPRYPSVCSPFVFSSPLLFAFSFLPSRVGEGALHEKQLPLCLLIAFHGQQISPTCWPCVATHLTGGTFRSPVYQSAGIPVTWLVCSRGSGEGVTPWAWR
ncbi:hypothetical protein AVEN_1579-1 [Araneus ventricosus]|uniref:Uncharacterized protein n=1 Tax=Araneus ventricosus TaxID=182803 RepID=A0A4Y2DT03_ARAVE|nr:hypothetical protein AVEN_1579-1 [Araneus ventricosus]